MPKFEISISYVKTVDAADKEDAERIINDIAMRSNLADEYGPFSSLDEFTEVEEVAE